MSILASIGKRLDFYSQACYNIRYGCMKQLETDSRRGGSAHQVHHKRSNIMDDALRFIVAIVIVIFVGTLILL